MATPRFVMNRAGIGQLLKSGQFAPAVRAVAERIAENIRQAVPDAEDGVEVDEYVTDRNAAAVTLRDPRARWLEARDGVITRAAHEAAE